MKTNAWIANSEFIKKIPLRQVRVPKSIRPLTDWMNRQVTFNPYTKPHSTVCDSPYATQGPYTGIETDLRGYDVTTGPLRGDRGGQVLT
jgi:hypothetical protein